MWRLIYFLYLLLPKNISCNKNRHSLQGKAKIFWILSFIFSVFPAAVSAQIIPDTTLNNNSLVTSNDQIHEITGGTIRGGNLFHSFEQFSLQIGQEAFINNPLNIANIISRVTGASPSYIDGLIRANGSANVFLINPHGIVFGANASLNIGGSLIVSTAESIKFPDASEFSAKNPQSSSVLSINLPIGLQYGSNPGNIQVQGTGNNLLLNPRNFEIIRNSRSPGLQVLTGKTLALIGNNIDIQGGNLTASDGRIEVGSVGAGSFVSLSPDISGFQFHYQGVNNFQNIHLSQAASIDSSGMNGGYIQLRGREITLTAGSAILTNTLANGVGGMLNVKGESLTISGTSANLPFFSGLFANAASTATGKGGNINLDVSSLSLHRGAQIGVNTYGIGQGGELTITAQKIELSGGSPFGPSGLFTAVAPLAGGNGGKMIVATENLRVKDGAQVSISTFGAGNGGSMNIQATDIELIGGSRSGPSGLFADVQPGAAGKGGTMLIEAQRLQLLDGANVNVSTYGMGDGGTLTVRTTQVNAIGEATNSASGLFAFTTHTGKGGNLLIETERLQLINGGQVVVSSIGSASAGELIVKAADFVELIGKSQRVSGLFANAVFGNGNGGDLNVFTENLIVSNGATITASNFSSSNPNIPPGSGAAGNVNIHAAFIRLDSQGVITTDTAAGDKGNININSRNIQIGRESRISTDAKGMATGGNININTDTLVAFANSDITANAEQSFAGRVSINAKGIFGTQLREKLTLESDITASSAAGAEFNGIVQLNNSDTDPYHNLVELPQNFIDPYKQIAASCKAKENSFVITGRDSLPENPTGIIRARTVWQDLRNLSSANKRTTEDTNIQQLSRNDPPQIIEFQGWIVNDDGQLELVAQIPEPHLHNSWNPTSNCATSNAFFYREKEDG